MAVERIWATTVGAEDCQTLPDDPDVICDICCHAITGLHMHIETVCGTPNEMDYDVHVHGFCSEECAGRWVAGEPVLAHRIVT